MHADSANIVQPVLKGVAKVPVILQLEDLECGAACLAMILGYYNKWIPIEQVRVDCGVSRDGSKALNIVEAARNYGLEAKGYRYEPEMLREKASFPCILHWNFNHFVVLCGFKGKRAIINDPEKGRQSISMEEFDLAFTGICLMFSPSASFRPGGLPARRSALQCGKRNRHVPPAVPHRGTASFCSPPGAARLRALPVPCHSPVSCSA